MCIVASAQPTRLSNTIIYSAEVLRDGQPTNVLGYQNSISTRPGPGAMILPIPSKGELGPENVVDASLFPRILKNYADAVERMKPRMRSFDRLSLTKGGLGIETNSRGLTFDSGSYTIALARDAGGMIEALARVPANKRPTIPASFLEVLGELYPEWPIAICCYDGSDVKGQVEPIFWHFESRFDDVLFAPAIDAHDGNPPRVGRNVQAERDHTLIFGSYRSEDHRTGANVMDDVMRVPLKDRWMFTHGICGTIMQERLTLNGDFVFPISSLLNHDVPGYIGADQIKIRMPGIDA